MWVFTNPINHLTEISAVINAPMHPIASSPYSPFVNRLPFFTRSYPVAAIIVGIAKRNENSTAVSRFMPRRSAPIMVAAARDTPGITESDCAHPIKNASLVVISVAFSL